MAKRLYVGRLADTIRGERFRSEVTPTAETHGDRYLYVVGPFRTVAGAEYMARYGANNPHCQTVAEAERAAARMRAGLRPGYHVLSNLDNGTNDGRSSRTAARSMAAFRARAWRDRGYKVTGSAAKGYNVRNIGGVYVGHIGIRACPGCDDCQA